MKYQIMTVFDTVSNLYGAPHYAQSKGAAIRGFSDEINRPDENNSFYKHPDDFRLCFLGTYNDDDATFELLSIPETLITGTSAKLTADTANTVRNLKQSFKDN
jgi:hypothetical protein